MSIMDNKNKQNPFKTIAEEINRERQQKSKYTEKELATIKSMASLASLSNPLMQWYGDKEHAVENLVEATLPRANWRIKEGVVEVLKEMQKK